MRPLPASLVVFCALAACLPGLAVAQTIYKVETTDGSILFTDAPPPGSKVLEERSGKPAPRPAGSTTVSAPQRTSGVPAMSGPGTPPGMAMPGATGAPNVPPSTVDRSAAAAQEVTAAEAALAVSKRRLELGKEPLPGERRGLAGGGSRLTEDYEQRVAGLEREVADAEARVQRAYAARNAAR